MPGLSGQGTTFGLPNFNGPLFGLSPTETPFTTMMGTFSGGGGAVKAKEFEWQTYDLRAPENPSHLEGQNAPTARNRVRASGSNVVQIFHSTLEVSYTKLAATYQRDGLAHHQPTAQANEMDWQVEQELKGLKRDMEQVFLTGAYAKPADNTTARKTRGILSAITTNVVVMPDADNATAGLQPSYLTEKAVLDLMQKTWDNGGIREDETRTIMVNSGVKRQLTKIFITDKNYDEKSRVHGGVRLQTIETDFGLVNIVLNRWMPTDTLGLFSMEACEPKFLLIPGKGFLFLEPLAKIGAADRAQIYGEVGLEYGTELQHGKITNIKTDAV